MQRSTVSGVPAAKIYIHNLFPTLTAQGTLQKRAKKDYRRQRTRASAARSCLLNQRGYEVEKGILEEFERNRRGNVI